ncbi:MAG: LptF/LptG family permease [Planctomycetota bacterium]|jgi:lipopolysaccharide export LptBFGC system permease protein LptF
MVFTLHRYIFRELMKVFLLAAVALTLMLSLGMILRPIQEFGAGPRQVVHLIGYFLPITLTFVLPMAALFSGALVYGRFASDNELDACRASGISLLTLVYPGFLLAVIVAIANLLLSFHVMPVFVQRAESSLKADAQQIIFRNIQRKGYYKPPDTGKEQYLIYADQSNLKEEMLWGVLIAEVKGVRIERITTAENAKVHFNAHRRFNEVQITANNIYRMGLGNDMGFSAERLPVTKEFPSLLGDNIKFKKIDEMKKIQIEPMRFYPIARLARAVYAQFTAELLAQDISRVTGMDGGERFYRLHSGGRIVEFTANNCVVDEKEEQEVELFGEVVVNESDVSDKNLLRKLECVKGTLYIEGDELAPTLTLELYSARWRQADGTELLDRRCIIRGLILPRSVTDNFKSEDVLECIRPEVLTSSLTGGPSERLAGLQSELARKIAKTFVEIKAETHSRLVFGVGCVSLIMIGIGLGIMKKGGHLLSAFGASSIPAAVLIVCIMMGKNVTKNPGSSTVSGILLMWGGLIILGVLAFVVYRKLLEH